MLKITIIGAGSIVFTRQLVKGILGFSELSHSIISLMDIDQERLELITKWTKKLVEQMKSEARIESTMDRRQALTGADYVIITINVGGLDALESDIKIPEKYGVKQCVGDTLGPGGVFRALRVVPVLLDICKDIEELCPNALLINYTNPMAINCWAINEVTKVKNIGLCSSTETTARQLASYIQVPYEEISYWAAGINHMSWFLEFKWNGEDAYPLLREKADDPKLWERTLSGFKAAYTEKDLVRFEIMKHFGYFPSEFSTHMSEYVPYFRKDDKVIKKIGLPSGMYLDLEKRHTEQAYKMIKKEISSEKKIKFEEPSEKENASYIIHCLETGTLGQANINVKNTGIITNLPYGCTVEVPCLINKNGIHPCYIGELPAQCAALNRSNISVQELTVKALVEKKRDFVFQAIMLDPLTAAVLSLDQVQKMVEEMFEAERKYLPTLS